MDTDLQRVAPLQFTQPLTTVFSIDISETWEYTLPDTVDPDISGSDIASCVTIPSGGYEVDIAATTKGPVIFDSRREKFLLQGALAESDIGNYTQTITLSDNISNNTSEFKFELEIANVTAEEIEELIEETTENPTESTVNTTQSLRT